MRITARYVIATCDGARCPRRYCAFAPGSFLPDRCEIRGEFDTATAAVMYVNGEQWDKALSATSGIATPSSHISGPQIAAEVEAFLMGRTPSSDPLARAEREQSESSRPSETDQILLEAPWLPAADATREANLDRVMRVTEKVRSRPVAEDSEPT
jgi:hypothetical protein